MDNIQYIIMYLEKANAFWVEETPIKTYLLQGSLYVQLVETHAWYIGNSEVTAEYILFGDYSNNEIIIYCVLIAKYYIYIKSGL